ncbi:DJ-1/PfpI family protein [Herpetosiphon sp. NSE202]|uniref:DJ-1/PfpI family protein n=1 Tax=Herpetosiphon sp. NSE202 TaxID=3351349 RepID=UPI00363FF1FB
MTIKSIGILLFNDAEELDFIGPLEVFGMASNWVDLKVNTVAEQAQTVKARYGLKIQPDYGFADAPAFDVVLVPGGLGARTHARHNNLILDYLRHQRDRGWVVSVCTGALVLSAAGLLDGQRATTHYTAFDLLAENSQITVEREQRYIIAPPIASSAGVSAGIDLALALLETWFTPELRAQVAERIEWR